MKKMKPEQIQNYKTYQICVWLHLEYKLIIASADCCVADKETKQERQQINAQGLK